jgi:hypothetical protein
LQLIRRSRVLSKARSQNHAGGEGRFYDTNTRKLLNAGIFQRADFRRFGKMLDRETMPRAVSAGLEANF